MSATANATPNATPVMGFAALLVLTRTGFETDAILEWQEWFATRSMKAEISSPQGCVVWIAASPGVLQGIWQRLKNWHTELAFSREILAVLCDCAALDRGTRAEQILAQWHAWQQLQARPLTFSSFAAYAPDSDAAKPLEPLAKALHSALNQQFSLDESSYQNALHLVFLTSSRAVLCLSQQPKSAPTPGGIARLKFPSASPSRSTLKLDEAFLYLLGPGEQARWVQRGMHAVDLGACPGGWSYQLVRRGMQVQAVDNGAMAEVLMRSGLVRHFREDGFRFSPKQAVDWMVCDMVENPLKVAQLCADWLSKKRCKHIMVNFKLPMKKRVAAIAAIKASLTQALGDSLVFRAKQLFHDREEITCLITRSEYLR